MEYLYDYKNQNEGVGKSVFEYSVAKDDIVQSRKPLLLDRSWKRGQLLNEKHYDFSNTNIIREVAYDYDLVEETRNPISGTKVDYVFKLGPEPCLTYDKQIIVGVGDAEKLFSTGLNIRIALDFDILGNDQNTGSIEFVNETIIGAYYEIDTVQDPINRCFCNEENTFKTRDVMFYFRNYDNIFQWNRLKSITETMDGVTKATTLFYDSLITHSNVTAAEVENSNGEITKTEIKYAHETNNTELINRNMVGVPLESESYVNGNLIGGSRLTFNDFGSGLYLPKRFEEKLSNESYRLVSEIDQVNAKGRTTLSHTRDGIYSTVLWGYDNELPKARVINNSQGISSAFYTSFEETDGTDDDKAISGTKVHIGNFSVSGITAGTYIKSYWENTGGSWEYQEETIVHNSGNIAFITSGKLDEVRIHPVGSQMQTNNFDPVQLRVVSQSDVNSTTSSYDYDDLGRLKTIRDKDKNIVQYNKYHYIE
jgi:YD repeat-containing protein